VVPVVLKQISENLFKPDYEQYSLVNVSNAILSHFGCPAHYPEYPFGLEKPGLMENVNKVILFLIDAMGMNSLNKILIKNPIFSESDILQASSVFPTTTSSSLASILTGVTPVEHGILGYTLYLKEFGTLVNMIELSSPTVGKLGANLSSKKILLSETIFEKLSKAGVKGCVLTSKNIRGSGFSNLINAGASVKSYQSFGDLFEKLKEMLDENGKLFGFVYWGLLDSIGHKLGVNSQAFERELHWLLRMIKEEISKNLKSNTLVLIIGDHGQIFTPWQNEIWWSWKDEIASFFDLPPGGEMRMMHIYTRFPKEVVEYIKEKYPSEAFAITKHQAIEMELFGKSPKKENLERIGDVILIARKDYSFYFKLTGREESLKSKHGSLSLDELLVPIILIRG